MAKDKEKRTGVQTENTKQEGSFGFLQVINILCIVVGALVLIGVLRIQWFDKTPQKVIDELDPPGSQMTITAHRGDIYTYDGRLLAMDIPQYQIYMDCTVGYDDNKRTEKEWNEEHPKKVGATKLENGKTVPLNPGKRAEEKWREKAKLLAGGLARIYPEIDSASCYKNIIDGREGVWITGKDGSKRLKKSKYLAIGGTIDHDTYLKVCALPLFNEGKYRGGMIPMVKYKREYPYGDLCRRLLGYITERVEENAKNIGLEGKFDFELKGEDGYEWQVRGDGGIYIHDFKKDSKDAIDGKNLHTTVDIDIQGFAHNALQKAIAANEDIIGGCMIVMDVKTGAVRAMVNLSKDNKNKIYEAFNYAIAYKGEPGSVFKTATLMTLIEEGKVGLETMIDCEHGEWECKNNKGKVLYTYKDSYLKRPAYASGKISVIEAFGISSNNIFRKLVHENYRDDAQHYVDRLFNYKLGEKIDFDIEGMITPKITRPSDKNWDGLTLASEAIGYAVELTPLQILTFYNAVANNGKMMKPYLVEYLEHDGTVQKRGPQMISSAICSASTLETVKKALRGVVERPTGTGKSLNSAPCTVAGKTGTARVALDGGGYETKEGWKKHQASFVGYFPYENPQYSAIITMYTRLMPPSKNVYGSEGCGAYKELIEKMYQTGKIKVK